MKTTYQLILLLLIAVITNSCEQNDIIDRTYPDINTLSVSSITSEGVEFRAEITDKGDQAITEYGFVWDKIEPVLGRTDQVSMKGNPTANSFKAEIRSTLLKNIGYTVKAYVKTKDLTVYGKKINFLSKGSKGPEVSSFSPLEASWNDTISIVGKHFSYVEAQNLVKFGTVEAHVLSATDTLLKVLSPENNGGEQVKINLTIANQTTEANEKFTYLAPKLYDFSPQTASHGDIITIRGENLGNKAEMYTVQFSSYENAEIVSVSNTELKVKVPNYLTAKESRIVVFVRYNRHTMEKKFVLKAPVISSLSQQTMYKTGEELIIYGKHFSPVQRYNTVYIDGVNCEIKNATTEQITVEVNEWVIPQKYVTKIKDVVVSVKVGDQYAYAPQDLHIQWESAWTRLKDFPGTARRMAVGFALNGNGYMGTGIPDEQHAELKDFWKYDPKNDSWTRISDLPGKARAGASAFVINEKAYVGMGAENGFTDDMERYKDMYSLDPATDQWTKLNDFPGISRSKMACFTNNGKGYMGTGYCGNDNPNDYSSITKDFWEYNPQDDSWSEFVSFPEQTDKAAGFTIGNTSYVYDYGKLYKLENNEWVNVNAPSLGQWQIIAFSIGDKGYFGLGNPHGTGSNVFYEWDPNTQESIRKDINYDNNRSEAVVFVIDNKAYVVGGVTYSSGGHVCLKDVWEFDPSKPVNQ